jgi:imidazolonepropionase-like amidohydrolase
MFSPRDIVTIITKNAAASTLKGNLLGTLEAGKAGDLVMLNGDPLVNISHLLDVALVIKGGTIVVDKRAAARR